MKNSLIRYSENRGFGIPFCFIVVSVVFLIKTPTTNDLITISGNIVYNQYLQVLQLEEIDKKFIFLEAQKDIAFKRIKSAESARIWVKEGCSDRCKIKQLELDGEVIIEYNYLKEITIPIVFGLMGLLLIPIVIRAKRKQNAREKSN